MFSLCRHASFPFRAGLIRLCNRNRRRLEIHRHQLWLHTALRIFLPILFPIIQRRHGDFGVFRVRMMHRLGIVPQRLLREPLRVAALQSPFRPGITIRVERHTRYTQTTAALLKFRRPVACSHGAKVWKKRSNCRTPFQNDLDFRAEANQRRLDANTPSRLQFCPRVTNRAGVRDVPVPDSERELKSLKISLKIRPGLQSNPC